jgi:hypothetical protein
VFTSIGRRFAGIPLENQAQGSIPIDLLVAK